MVHFPCGSAGKESAARWETWVQSLGWEDPLEKKVATHSRILAWKIPWTKEPGIVHGVTKSRTQLLKNIASFFQTASTCIFSCVSYTNSGFVFILTIIILQRKKMWPNDLKYLPRERQLANGSM